MAPERFRIQISDFFQWNLLLEIKYPDAFVLDIMLCFVKVHKSPIVRIKVTRFKK